jgi:hypothetical protein
VPSDGHVDYQALLSSGIKPIGLKCIVLGRGLLDIRQPISLRKGDWFETKSIRYAFELVVGSGDSRLARSDF